MPRMIGTYSVALAIFFASSTAFGQTDSEEIQARVKDGQKVSITDAQGLEVKGRISALTADGLTLLVNGKAALIPYDQIVRIDRPNDSLANGALIGFGVGAALGLAAIASEENDNVDCLSAFFCGDPGAGNYVAATLLMGGLGTAVGVGIDALVHRKREIYRRGESPHASMGPVLGHGVRGAIVSLTW